MIALFNHWNIILLLIAGCSLVGCAIFCERLLCLKRAEVDSDRFLLGIRQYIQDGNIVAAIEECERIGGTMAAIVRAGLMRHHRTQPQIEMAMENTGRLEIALLEKNARILSMISCISPLIGLLGTVLGFIQAFGEMRLSGLADITATGIGSAMEYALITTAAGLAVAIPALLAYNYLVSRIENIVLEIQIASSEVVELLLARQEG
jgi:biopolymer transport protein ExbB